MPPVTLFIVDDHRVFLQALKTLLSGVPELDPIATLTDPELVVPLVQERHPDVVVMDLELGNVSGITLTSELCTLPSPPP